MTVDEQGQIYLAPREREGGGAREAAVERGGAAAGPAGRLPVERVVRGPAHRADGRAAGAGPGAGRPGDWEGRPGSAGESFGLWQAHDAYLHVMMRHSDTDQIPPGLPGSRAVPGPGGA